MRAAVWWQEIGCHLVSIELLLTNEDAKTRDATRTSAVALQGRVLALFVRSLRVICNERACSVHEYRQEQSMPAGATRIADLLLDYSTRNDYSHVSLIVAPIRDCLIFFFVAFLPTLVVSEK